MALPAVVIEWNSFVGEEGRSIRADRRRGYLTRMSILELHALISTQIDDPQTLMHELDPEITVTAEMLERAAKALETHIFAAVEIPVPELAEGLVAAIGRSIGCASLCVFYSPTGRKASIEDVVVSSGSRRQGIGRALVGYIIDFARRVLAPLDLHLTSRPDWVAANEMYKRLGLRGEGRMLIG